MVQVRIKEEALRTFLFAYSAYYEALSQEQLCEMFALENKAVNTLVSYLKPACCLEVSYLYWSV